MNTYRNVKDVLPRAASVLGLALLSMVPLQAGAANQTADHRGNVRFVSLRAQQIRGIVVTGANHVLGKPIFDWGEPFGTANYPTLYAFNPNGAKPLPLDENSPSSTLLASGVSPDDLLTVGKEIKPEWINVPLRDVAVLTDFNNIQKRRLRGVLEANPLELSQSEPANPITLGQWMGASGDLSIDCLASGANIRLSLSHLIPRRIYSVWGTMQLPAKIPSPPPDSQELGVTLPVGGTPNVFVTDNEGNATYERSIKFCPLDTSTDVPRMATLEVMFHANHQTYGAIPSPGLVAGEWPGVIQFSHIVFPISVKMLNQ